MSEVGMQLEHCTWSGKQLVFNRAILFKLKVNPFNGETILEQEDLDIYVLAASYDDAVHQAGKEIGYIWDEYIMRQKAVDSQSRAIALQLATLVASYGELRV